MIAALLAVAMAAEPPWLEVLRIDGAAGLPEDECVTRATVIAPGEPAPVPREDTAPDADAVAAMPTVDVAPGAAGDGPSAELRARLGIDGSFSFAGVPVEPLRGDASALARVREVLERAGRRQEVVRLAFWGASHVAGEFFTGEVRRVLQDRYGDAGHGFVMPAPPWKGYRANDVNVCAAGAWASDFVDRRGGRGDGRLGWAGISVEASDPSSMGWVQTTRTNPHGRAVSRFEVMFLRQPGGGTLEMAVDAAPPVRVPTAGAPGPGGALLAVPDGPHRLRVSPAGDGPVRLLGVNMERDVPGVVVDAMGVSGRTASSWLAWDAELMRAFLSRRMPDMVVLAYGTNEANDRRLSPEGYRDTLRAVLARMRDLAPEAACVLIGPSDRAKKVRGTVYAVWEPTAWVARVQREVGPEFGCATWDLQAATGGPGSILPLSIVTPPLAAPDLIHFRAEGYRELGRRFVAALDGAVSP